jgi:pimeloyl-ACP methyl ester carboxylesterase
MRLNFRAIGDGPPLIILHGFLGSLDNWRTASDRMSSRFKIISVDLRNHGRSPHHPAMSYPAMADDIYEFCNQQNIASAHLLGHSMGGKVAMQFATTHPQRIEKLIVVDIAPKGYPASHEATLAALRNLDLGSFRSFGEIDAALAPQIRTPSIRQFLMKNLARRPDASFCWRIDLDAILKNYHELTKAIVLTHAFPKPACFIRGGRSDYVADEDLPLIEKKFPRAEIVTLPDAGHWVHADAPEDFLKIVTDFLGARPSGLHSSPVEEER